MRKALLITTIICGMMAAGTAFSQHTQSLSFIPSGTIFQQNDTFSVETFLTYYGYSAYGFSFWLKTATVGASFFHITSEEHFPLCNNGYAGPNEIDYYDNNYCSTHYDWGGSPQPLILLRPGECD